MESDDDLRGLVGLQNLGNTCYINAALQALSNCQPLTRFVLDCSSLIKESGLSRCYSELINEIWNPQNSQYAVPTSIIRNIKCIYPAFRGCTQQDTQEFLRCFLEQLHDELKQCPKAEKVKEPRSIISDIFDFNISSSIVCSSCNNISTTKETFRDLSVPIPSSDHPFYQQQQREKEQQERIEGEEREKAKREKEKKDDNEQEEEEKEDTDDEADSEEGDDGEQHQGGELQTTSYLDSIPLAKWFLSLFTSLGSWFWGPQVSLHDCLSVFFGTDPLEGENEYSCDICTKKNRGVKYLKILELPEVLCIHFKRYESVGSAKITTHVSFPLTGLDLEPFMCSSSKPQCTTYNLIACICHHGSALLTGHYTTYALNCYDDQWYEFDDQYVTCVSSYQVENSEAYILFYQKCDWSAP